MVRGYRLLSLPAAAAQSFRDMSGRKKQAVQHGHGSGTCRRHLLLRTWSELLADYDAEHTTHEREQVQWFATQASLPVVIRLAAEATNHQGKRYDHQYRIRKVAMATANELLLAHAAEIESASTFSNAASGSRASASASSWYRGAVLLRLCGSHRRISRYRARSCVPSLRHACWCPRAETTAH